MYSLLYVENQNKRRLILELVLIRGIPGSGKSTMAKEQFSEHDHFETDMYFIDPVTGKFIFDGSKLVEAHAWCLENAENALKKGHNVVVSNTFIKLEHMRPYVKLCDKYEAELKVYELFDMNDNSKDIPPYVIARCISQWESISE